jgi:hypothetical protein
MLCVVAQSGARSTASRHGLVRTDSARAQIFAGASIRIFLIAPERSLGERCWEAP